MRKSNHSGELPLGLGLALAQNPEAMKRFSGLSKPARSELLRKAHGVSSKNEMQALVQTLTAPDVT